MKIIKVSSKLNIQLSCDVSGVTYYEENSYDGNDINLHLDNQKAIELAKQSLQSVFNIHDSNAFENIKKRYMFDITKFDNLGKDLRFNVNFFPIGSDKGEEQLISPDNPNYDYYQKYRGGKSGKVIYKNPKDAISEIPISSNLSYRGMSWEEWQSIRRTGKIKSRGNANLGQEGLTFFSPNPTASESYASWFAPFEYQITPKTPGVVISVPSKFMLTHEDRNDIPNGELAIEGSLSSGEIKNVWFLIAVSNQTVSDFDIIIPWKMGRRYVDGNPKTFFEADPSKARKGSGTYTIGTSYKIIELPMAKAIG